MDVRRKRRDEDAPVAQWEDLPERLADDALRGCEAGPLGVGGVAEHEVDAAVAQLGKLADVGLQPVDGRVVKLVVAGVHDAAGRRLEHDRDCVGNRVRHAHELDPERPQLSGRVVRVHLA